MLDSTYSDTFESIVNWLSEIEKCPGRGEVVKNWKEFVSSLPGCIPFIGIGREKDQKVERVLRKLAEEMVKQRLHYVCGCSFFLFVLFLFCFLTLISEFFRIKEVILLSILLVGMTIENSLCSFCRKKMSLWMPSTIRFSFFLSFFSTLCVSNNDSGPNTF